MGRTKRLLADPDIDAVYNPLPNHLHVPWSIKAMEAGKHVLCEKPIALTTAEAQTLADAAKKHPQLKVMEAFMYRHHPQWQRAEQIVSEGRSASCGRSNSFFSYFNDDPNNIRNQADIGGGGLMDIGCYNISLSRFIFDAEPRPRVRIVEYDPQMQTDRLASGLLDFGTGTATFTCSTQLAQLSTREYLWDRRDGSKSRFRSMRRPTGRARCGIKQRRQDRGDHVPMSRPIYAPGRSDVARDPERHARADADRGRGSEYGGDRRGDCQLQ